MKEREECVIYPYNTHKHFSSPGAWLFIGIDGAGCSGGMLKLSVMHWCFWQIHNWYLDIFNFNKNKDRTRIGTFCTGLLSNCGISECADTASWLNNQFIVKNGLNISELLISFFRDDSFFRLPESWSTWASSVLGWFVCWHRGAESLSSANPSSVYGWDLHYCGGQRTGRCVLRIRNTDRRRNDPLNRTGFGVLCSSFTAEKSSLNRAVVESCLLLGFFLQVCVPRCAHLIWVETPWPRRILKRDADHYCFSCSIRSWFRLAGCCLTHTQNQDICHLNHQMPALVPRDVC